MPERSLFDAVVALYRDAFQRHGHSPSAVLWPKGRQELRFEALTRFVSSENFAVLDYGCGLAHMKPFLDSRFASFSYAGVDIVPEFIAENRRRHADGSFAVIGSHHDVVDDYDYVLLSGVFNVRYGREDESHKKIVRDTLTHLFNRCRVLLAVNFMSDRVDYRQPNSYHQNPLELHDFVSQHLTPRLVVDQSYMPYEFTLTAFRDAAIVRPDNVYKPWAA